MVALARVESITEWVYSGPLPMLRQRTRVPAELASAACFARKMWKPHALEDALVGQVIYISYVCNYINLNYFCLPTHSLESCTKHGQNFRFRCTKILKQALYYWFSQIIFILKFLNENLECSKQRHILFLKLRRHLFLFSRVQSLLSYN